MSSLCRDSWWSVVLLGAISFNFTLKDIQRTAYEQHGSVLFRKRDMMLNAVVPSKMDPAFEFDMRASLRLCGIRSNNIHFQREAQAVGTARHVKGVDLLLTSDLGAGTLDLMAARRNPSKDMDHYDLLGYQSFDCGGMHMDSMLARYAFDR